MFRIAFVLAVASAAFTASIARAQNEPVGNAPADSADSHYTFSRVQDGYLRLDNHTGQISFCNKRTVGWACQLVPEDRVAFEGEIARLQEENAALKREFLTRGLPLPGGIKGDPPLAQSERSLKPRNDANIERMRLLAEKLWQRLVDLIVSLQKDVLKKS